jgi:hypothetical protein
MTGRAVLNGDLAGSVAPMLGEDLDEVPSTSAASTATAGAP